MPRAMLLWVACPSVRHALALCAVTTVYSSQLDARPSPTLARLAPPLATRVRKISFLDKTNNNWLSRQRPLRDLKTNFASIIYSRSSTNPEQLAEIDSVDLEIIDLTGIAKNK